MTKGELLSFYNGLLSVSNLKGVRFIYAVVKNKKAIASEVEAIRSANKPSKEYLKYEHQRTQICLRFCEKDDKGNPKHVQDGGDIAFKIVPEMMEKFEAEMKKLKSTFTFKDAMADKEKVEAEYAELLKEDAGNFELVMVTLDDIDQNITTQQFESISLMIEDPE